LAVNAVYAGSAVINDVAWYSGNSGNATHPVGGKAPNGLGIYDMTGNVWLLG
jgi:formylglycine-generating enzyme required for sulfatase activity